MLTTMQSAFGYFTPIIIGCLYTASNWRDNRQILKVNLRSNWKLSAGQKWETYSAYYMPLKLYQHYQILDCFHWLKSKQYKNLLWNLSIILLLSLIFRICPGTTSKLLPWSWQVRLSGKDSSYFWREMKQQVLCCHYRSSKDLQTIDIRQGTDPSYLWSRGADRGSRRFFR